MEAAHAARPVQDKVTQDYAIEYAPKRQQGCSREEAMRIKLGVQELDEGVRS